MIAISAVTKTLGLGSALVEPMAFVSAIERGFLVSTLDKLAEAISPGDEAFKYRIVPRPTLARRRQQTSHRLTMDESARLARLAKVWTFALDVWGSDAEARTFLGRPHSLLDGRKPVDLILANDFGADVVENLLGGLKYGIAI